MKKKFKNAQVIFSGIVCRKDVHNRKIWDLNRHIFGHVNLLTGYL